VLLTWSEKRWPGIQEALIGLLFVTAAAGGILLLANNPHGGEHLQALLAGPAVQFMKANGTALKTSPKPPTAATKKPAAAPAKKK